ncbi:MAG: BlaI/MecI/CopY family transcriptional regulator [Verrucomicrobiae bacterium]|nr:BlaI/MecI/CopY family transcriptional regulator [Verrucomicrobiae bacterium]
MNLPERPHLRVGDLQLRILQVLWDADESSVATVHKALQPERDLAYTTIATMLRKMEDRGLVGHREEGRTFLYRARVAADQVGRSMTDHVVESLFQGSLAGAVNHLLQTREVTREDLNELERLIRAAKRRIS